MRFIGGADFDDRSLSCIAAVPQGPGVLAAVRTFPASFNAAESGSCDGNEVHLRCVLVDDNLEFLEAARRLLEGQGIDVVGVASTTAEAIQRVAELRPDVTLVDVNLGEESGSDLARHIAAWSDEASTRVILVSAYAETDLADALPPGQTIPFMSKADLSRAAIRAAMGLTTDGEPAG